MHNKIDISFHIISGKDLKISDPNQLIDLNLIKNATICTYRDFSDIIYFDLMYANNFKINLTYDRDLNDVIAERAINLHNALELFNYGKEQYGYDTFLPLHKFNEENEQYLRNHYPSIAKSLP